MRRSALSWIVVSALVVFAATGARSAVLRPAAPVAAATQSADQAVPAPQIRARIQGSVRSLRGAAAEAQQPAVAVHFTSLKQGTAIIGCGYGSPSTPGGRSSLEPCTIIRTSDGGTGWHDALTTKAQLSQIAFPSAADGFAWTQGGFCASATCPTTVYASTDGGRRWTLRYQGHGTFQSIAFASATRAFAISTAGTLLRSGDGARSWQPALAAPSCRFQSVSTQGAVGIAVGSGSEGACAYRTMDGGAIWLPWLTGLQTQAMAPAFDAFIEASGFSKYIGGPAKAVASCSGSSAAPDGMRGAWLTVLCSPINPDMIAIMRTTDGGNAWHLAWSTSGCAMGCQSMGGSANPLLFVGAVAFRAAPFGVSRSTDGGQTWTNGQPLCSQLAECFPSLNFLSAKVGFAATPSGVFTTPDGGRTWRRIWPRSGPGPLASFSAVGRSTALALPQGAQGTILETTDGGRSWKTYARVWQGVTLSGLDFLSTRSGFAFGQRQGTSRGSPVLLFTPDGGQSFHAVPLPQGTFGTIQVVQAAFLNAREGIVMDSLSNIWRTTDGGQRWARVAVPALGLPQTLGFAGGRRLYATVFQRSLPSAKDRSQHKKLRLRGHFGMAVSSNQGSSWQSLAQWPWPPKNGQFMAPLLAVHGSDVFMFAYGGLLRSTDGGRSFTEISLPALVPLLPTALTFADQQHGWLLTSSGSLYATTDAGRMWQQVGLLQ